MKNIIRIGIFLLIGIGFIWWFVAKLTPEEIDEVIYSFKHANYYWFSLAVLINILSHYIRAIRWKQLISPLGYNPKLMPTFFAVMCGYLANLAVPRLGEIVRCGLVRNSQKIPFEKVAGTVIAERAVDTLLFVLILFSSLLLEYNLLKDYLYDNFKDVIDFSNLCNLFLYIGIGIVLIIILIVLFRKRLGRSKIYLKIKDIFLGLMEGVKTIFKLKNPLLFIFNSLFIWFLWILGTYIIFLCLNDTKTLSFEIAIIITVFGAIGPIITPGGIGIYPAIIAESLAIYLISKPIGYASGWLMWIVSQVGIIVLGLYGFIYFSSKHHNILKLLNKKDDE